MAYAGLTTCKLREVKRELLDLFGLSDDPEQDVCTKCGHDAFVLGTFPAHRGGYKTVKCANCNTIHSYDWT